MIIRFQLMMFVLQSIINKDICICICTCIVFVVLWTLWYDGLLFHTSPVHGYMASCVFHIRLFFQQKKEKKEEEKKIMFFTLQGQGQVWCEICSLFRCFTIWQSNWLCYAFSDIILKLIKIHFCDTFNCYIIINSL